LVLFHHAEYGVDRRYQLDGNSIAVALKVTGYVLTPAVRDNQQVKAGDLLIKIVCLEALVLALAASAKDGTTPPSTARQTAASARRDAVGAIYPDLPRLTRLNSHPINEDSYLINWRWLGLL
jgi:hypothetical protein